MVEKIKSEKYSLQGWKFWTWFKGNGQTIKEVLKVGVPFVITYVSTSNPALIGIFTIVGKFVLDVAEYYVKQY